MYQHAAQLQWLSGDWQGELGPRQVDENWSRPEAGTICARARVVADGRVDLIELIYIHETEQGLALTLQQLDAALQPGLHQQMHQIQVEPLRRCPDHRLCHRWPGSYFAPSIHCYPFGHRCISTLHWVTMMS